MIKVTSVSLDEEVAKELEDMSTRLGISKSMAITMLIMKEVESPITKEDRRRLLGPIIDSRAERKIERANKVAKKESDIQSNIVSNKNTNKEIDKETNDEHTKVEPIEPVGIQAPATPSRVIQKMNVMDDKDSIERSDDDMI